MRSLRDRGRDDGRVQWRREHDRPEPDGGTVACGCCSARARGCCDACTGDSGGVVRRAGRRARAVGGAGHARGSTSTADARVELSPGAALRGRAPRAVACRASQGSMLRAPAIRRRPGPRAPGTARYPSRAPRAPARVVEREQRAHDDVEARDQAGDRVAVAGDFEIAPGMWSK